ncbi:gamma-glutamyltransferase [Alphaproteobacteria bacterium]|nr:gamma-glutamyltransferase [Alphaproteobacteria bacterium]
MALVFTIVFISSATVAVERSAVLSRKDVFRPVFAPNGMVASQEATASRIGRDILKKGGNAVDAAIAVGLALAVTLPRAGNLGGGGFMLVHMAASEKTIAIDYREMAPQAASKNMYLKSDGSVDKKASRYGYSAVGVPGTVAGFALVHKKFGSLPWRVLVEPAITLATNGIVVTDFMANGLERRKETLGKWASTRAVFFRDGVPVKPGDRLVQKDLAWSLSEIARHGASSFYDGEIAKRVVRAMRRNGGLITAEDLAAYRPVMREPVRGRYREVEVISMPPPSSGGIHLIQMLNMIEAYDIRKMGPQSAASLHIMVEAMRRAFADRSKHLGDPAFWNVPIKGLISKKYAGTWRKTVDPNNATRSADVAPGIPRPYESPDTTHFTVADHFGNFVTNTYTLNFSYGSRVVADGTGILLNNEMDDFSAKPGAPNAFGLVGGAANAIEPLKRPLSSMTPLILFKDGKPWLASGGPGGSRIITNMLQLVVNIVDHGMNIAEATVAPRVHHQWLPDTVRVEETLSVDTTRLLLGLGHRLKVGNAMGSTQSVMRTGKGYYGFSDPRRPGALTIGY